MGALRGSILIVDDLEFMREELKKILTRAGAEIAGEAENGRDGLYCYIRLNPDLVLLDITMPRMDGLTALKKIKEYDPLARVVMCSALGERKMIIKAIRLGAEEFIVKPFKPERVISAVSTVLDSTGKVWE